MKVVDQNSAAAALEKALVPGSSLVDGRTEKERLAFLCEFATLINFYDQTNTINGNWQPFLLKDPVFLLAYISRVDFQKEHKLFVRTCTNLQDAIIRQNNKENSSRETDDDVVVLFNQLFDQLIRIFLSIENWTHYMQMGSEEYELKKYVLNQVKQTFSSYLWAVLSLRDFLASSQAVSGNSRKQIIPVSQYVLGRFTDLVWTTGAGVIPFMQVLGLYTIDEINKVTPATGNQSGPIPAGIVITTQDYFNGLKNTGETLFGFYHTVIRHAPAEYETVKNIKSRYPDTLLLRAFNDLLKVQQAELNKIADRHLDFYYRAVLKQSEQTAVADHVFITAVLGKNISAFDLPAGTLFNAGTDAQKNPILFSSEEEVSLNAAVITNVYSLAPVVPPNETMPQLYLQQVTTPGAVTTDENGQALPWETFGGITNQDKTTAKQTQVGFSFASPMLFLREGTRKICINLVFDKTPDPAIFTSSNITVFLSTQKAWYTASNYSFLPLSRDAKNVSIQIELATTDPPIEAFTANPDGLNSSWPMFKIIFSSFYGLATPPVLTSIGIDVIVTGAVTFSLYNDNGLLSTKTPFQLFGPVVNLNSNFLIGSNEIFSKPVNWISLELDWDTLPQYPATTPPTSQGFATYYSSYNTILFPGQTVPTALTLQPVPSSTAQESTTTTVTSDAAKTKSPGRLKKFFKGVWNVLKWPLRIAFFPIWLLIKYLSDKKSAQPQATLTPPAFVAPVPPIPGQFVPFSNICFSVAFSRLDNHAWDTINMYNYSDSSAYSTWLNNPAYGANPPIQTGNEPFQLFDTSLAGGNLNSKTVFGFFAPSPDAAAEIDPTIQNSTLAYDGTNGSGFIKMTLMNPAYGFGASVYPNVVTDIAMQNATKIAVFRLTPLDPSTLVPPANIPFAPKVKTITASYGASQQYDLTQATGNYPIQYFYYTPFAAYTTYDNSPALEVNYSPDNSIVGQPSAITGLQLVPSFICNAPEKQISPCCGTMYIGLSGLIPSNPLSLFFELATSYAAVLPEAQVSYYYLSEKEGWQELSLLKDGTNQFTCSGIVTVNLPADIASQNAAMPVNMSWIAIAASGDPTLSSFAQTVLLAPNGMKLVRTGTAYLEDTTAPVISSGSITKPQTAIPQIASLAQPFPSFGGKAAEDQTQMYQRVSNRLKTKKRAVSGNDIFTMVRQQFPDIYFTSAVFDPDANVTTVYAVEGMTSAADANAFRPYVSECEIEAIAHFLKNKISLFSNITVSNYSFQTVSVNATVTVKQGYVPQAMSTTISNALNVFLSPWVAGGAQQVLIGQPVTSSQVAAFIRQVPGVEAVSGISLELPALEKSAQTLSPNPGELFVPALVHPINAVPVE